MKTLDQRRAHHAWETVTSAAKYQDSDDFKRAVMSLPAQIVGSGLGPALSFLLAKRKTVHLLQALSDWVLDKYPNPDSTRPAPEADALLQQFKQADTVFLRRATSETLAYLQWLKRFAEAELPATRS